MSTLINDPDSERPTSDVDESAGDGSFRETRSVGIRWSAVLAVSLPLIVANCGWIANSEIKTYVTEVTISSLFMGVTFILFFVTLLNLAVRKFAGASIALNQAELMVVYSLLSMSSSIAGVTFFGVFTPFLTNAFYYATPANGWHSWQYLLPWYIGPRDPHIYEPFYAGHSSVFTPGFLHAWAGPLAVWCGFLLVLLWMTMCAAVLVRRRWESEEHLQFPVLALPIELTRDGSPLLHNKMMWAGFAVPLTLHSLNSLASIYPGLPSFKINSAHDFVQDMSLGKPWSGLDTMYYMLHPAGVGFGFLINTDVSFSLWFFYLLNKAMNVVGVLLGLRDIGQGMNGAAAAQFPFTGFQGYGAWLALGLTALWTGRKYYAAYIRRAFRPNDAGLASADHSEPLSARAALLGFVGGFIALCAFVWSTGGSWWLPVAFLGIYVLIMVALTRIRAEAAVLCTELGWINPQNIVTNVFGTVGFSKMDIVHTGMLSWFNGDDRSAAMPHELEAMVGVYRAGGAIKRLLPALMLAAVVAMVSALLFDLQLYYVHGASTGNVNQWRVSQKGCEAWNMVGTLMHNPRLPKPGALGGIVVGVAVTCLLAALRARFVGFPLHPAGYVLNT